MYPCVFNTKIDGVDAYATSDLLAPHPTKPGYWKVHGRVDDQIMHSTGEKVRSIAPSCKLDPGPFLMNSVHPSTCIVDKPRPLRFVLYSPFAEVRTDLIYPFRFVENILNQDPRVQAAVMFGRGRFYPGVVVDPKPEFRFDPIDETALSDFRNLIWWVTPFIDL